MHHQELRRRVVKEELDHPGLYQTRALLTASDEMLLEIKTRVGEDAPEERKFAVYRDILARDGTWAGEVEAQALAISQFAEVYVLRLWRCKKTGRMMHDEKTYVPESAHLVQHSISLLQTPDHFDILVKPAASTPPRQATRRAAPCRPGGCRPPGGAAARGGRRGGAAGQERPHRAAGGAGAQGGAEDLGAAAGGGAGGEDKAGGGEQGRGHGGTERQQLRPQQQQQRRGGGGQR